MRRVSLILFLLLNVLAAAAAPSNGSGDRESLRLGGTPLQLFSARGEIWVLTCNRDCSGQGKRSVGRVVEINPKSGHVIASATLARPGAIAVGSRGVYATDFWRDRLRRFDPRTLRPLASLHLALPFFIVTSTTRDDAFLPEAVAAAGSMVWIATARGALARADPRLHRVTSMLRLPGDAFQALAATPRTVWLSEGLLGVYRVSSRTNRIVARIALGPPRARLDPIELVPAGKGLLVLGEWTRAASLTNRNGLALLNPASNGVVAVRPLPPGQLKSAFGAGSLWVARMNGSTLEQINPRNGNVVRSFRRRVGIALTVAGGQLWTVFQDGSLRRLRIG